MVSRIDIGELLSTWRGLCGTESGGKGWSTIPLFSDRAVRVLAGRHFPGDEEGLLFALPPGYSISPSQLPQGRGFLVSSVELMTDTGPVIWITLSRRSTGSLEIFAMMCVDLTANIRLHTSVSEDRRIQRFVARVRAWQDFMQSGAPILLGPDAEIGLFGELIFLQQLLNSGLDSFFAVDCWKGPLDGVQDFVFAHGGIEVKTTAASVGFSAVIGSLDQLDDSLRNPLFLCAIRLGVEPGGQSLRTKVEEVRELFNDDTAAHEMLDAKLFKAGYLDVSSAHYNRTFEFVGLHIYRVDRDFPCLTSGRVPSQIKRASYLLELDQVVQESMTLSSALREMRIY